MTTDMTYADVVAGVGATLAAYVQALDDGRTDDVVATFCDEGVCVLGDLGTHAGHDDLRKAYAGWQPVRPQRHVVVNTHVTEWSQDEATAISDVIFMSKGGSGWATHLVGRYHDTLRHEDGTWRFVRRVATFES